VPWDELHAEYAWVRNLAGCPQELDYHAEGDVWIHTRMVCECLADLPAWRDLDPTDRCVLFAGALLHDVAKPECTRTDADGRISSRGHSRRGTILARQILWRMQVALDLRERVANLVRWHQVPFYLLERDDPRRLAVEISLNVRPDHLALLAEADARGRICRDQQRILDNIALFREYCREEGCLSSPRAFASDHARFLYFQKPGRHPDVKPHEDFKARVVMMSGLPGSGKDHWVRSHLPDSPVISLDALRSELDIDPTDEQGPVLEAARARARELLRQGRDFVWNATNLSRQFRSSLIELFAGYGAHVRIVYLEVPEQTLLAQNRRREAVVPQRAIDRMIDRWEVPTRTEAHEVEWVVAD
jgi:predicted kinase